MTDESKLQITLTEGEASRILEIVEVCLNAIPRGSNIQSEIGLLAIKSTFKLKLDRVRTQQTISENGDNAEENDCGYPDY